MSFCFVVSYLKILINKRHCTVYFAFGYPNCNLRVKCIYVTISIKYFCQRLFRICLFLLVNSLFIFSISLTRKIYIGIQWYYVIILNCSKFSLIISIPFLRLIYISTNIMNNYLENHKEKMKLLFKSLHDRIQQNKSKELVKQTKQLTWRYMSKISKKKEIL